MNFEMVQWNCYCGEYYDNYQLHILQTVKQIAMND